jgi:hypothetical protein
LCGRKIRGAQVVLRSPAAERLADVVLDELAPGKGGGAS